MGEECLRRMTECFGYNHKDKSLKRWHEVSGMKRILKNYFIITLCKILPDIETKNRLYRKTGMKIGKDVSIFGSNLDIFFPELIEIGDNSVIGNNVSVLTHEFVVGGWRRGPVKIGKNVTVGTVTLVLPGVEIGDNATVAAYSLVNKNVEPGSFVGGVPIKKLKRRKR
jgi:acetyltransferase-like isoleucine patch superfamily enzyme